MRPQSEASQESDKSDIIKLRRTTILYFFYRVCFAIDSEFFSGGKNSNSIAKHQSGSRALVDELCRLARELARASRARSLSRRQARRLRSGLIACRSEVLLGVGNLLDEARAASKKLSESSTSWRRPRGARRAPRKSLKVGPTLGQLWGVPEGTFFHFFEVPETWKKVTPNGPFSPRFRLSFSGGIRGFDPKGPRTPEFGPFSPSGNAQLFATFWNPARIWTEKFRPTPSGRQSWPNFS